MAATMANEGIHRRLIVVPTGQISTMAVQSIFGLVLFVMHANKPEAVKMITHKGKTLSLSEQDSARGSCLP